MPKITFRICECTSCSSNVFSSQTARFYAVNEKQSQSRYKSIEWWIDDGMDGMQLHSIHLPPLSVKFPFELWHRFMCVSLKNDAPSTPDDEEFGDEVDIAVWTWRVPVPYNVLVECNRSSPNIKCGNEHPNVANANTIIPNRFVWIRLMRTKETKWEENTAFNIRLASNSSVLELHSNRMYAWGFSEAVGSFFWQNFDSANCSANQVNKYKCVAPAKAHAPNYKCRWLESICFLFPHSFCSSIKKRAGARTTLIFFGEPIGVVRYT